MTVEPLVPDVAVPLQRSHDAKPSLFARALDAIGETLRSAEGAEDRFATHTGSLQDAVIARARADVALSIATAAAQRSAQALQSILNMQV